MSRCLRRALPHKCAPLLVLLLLVLANLTSQQSADAQTAASAALTQLDIQGFPKITAYLDVHDAQGGFVHDLQPQDIFILEDNLQAAVSQLEELHPGVQFVMAIAPGSSFNIRDAQGVSRFEHLLEGLAGWTTAQNLPAADSLSLVVASGPEVTSASTPQEILTALQGYRPPPTITVPDLEILSQALDMAAAPTSRPGMGKAVLFITAPQSVDVTLGLQSLAARASQAGVRLSIWLVSAADYFGSSTATQLQDLATQSGGRYFAFSGSEAVPDLETYLEPLRHIYRLAYNSLVTTSGSHQVAAQVAFGEEQITSPALNFEITLQAPQPVFVSPPAQIQRTFPSQTSTQSSLTDLLPSQQKLEVIINFPDGHPRPLSRTTLYVDGAIADQNLEPPYDTFTWDLSSYAENGDHLLKVEVLDSLGLSGTSVDTIVTVSVPRAEQNILTAFSRHKALAGGILALLAASLLVLILILGGHIQPAALPGRPRAGRNAPPGATGMPKKTRTDLRKQPRSPEKPAGIASQAPLAKAQRHWPAWMGRLRRPPHQATSAALAYLTPLVESGEATLPAPLPIESEDVLLGRDPLQAAIVLDDPSVGLLHAHLYRVEDSFWLADAGSVAGTWVNYTPISQEGRRLEHNDVVHIGRVGFRFTLRQPGRLPKPVITPLEPEA